MTEWGGVIVIIASKARVTVGVGLQFGKTVSDKMVFRSCWKSRHKNSYGPVPCWIRSGLAALLWLCVTQFICGIGAVGETKHVIQKDAEFDITYNDSATSENQTIYAFNHTVSRNKVSLRLLRKTFVLLTVISSNAECNMICSFISVLQTEGVRVSVDVLSQGLESPILFVVRQKQAVLSFQVPLILRGL